MKSLVADYLVKRNGVGRFKELSSNVSIRFALLQTLCRLDKEVPRQVLRGSRETVFSRRDRLIIEFLNRQLIDVIGEWSDRDELGRPFADSAHAPVWMCWLQGLDRMPSFQRAIVDHSMQLLGDHAVTVVDLRNIGDYASIPGYVFDKFKSGALSFQMLSDILRHTLLRDHGGIWLDATVYVARPLPADVMKSPFYSAKGIRKFAGAYRYFNILNWESYFLAGWPGANFYGFMTDALLEYWHKNDFLIQYLLENYIAAIALSTIGTIAAQYERLPVNNTLVEQLCPLMLDGAPLTRDLNRLLFEGDTYVYKIPLRNYSRGESAGEYLVSDYIFG